MKSQTGSLALWIVGTGLLLGIAGTTLFYNKLIGLSFPLYSLLVLVALLALGRPAGRAWLRRNAWPCVPLLFFASMVAVRDDALINFLNFLAVLTLGGLFLHYLPLPRWLDTEPLSEILGSLLQLGFLLFPFSMAELFQAWRTVQASRSSASAKGAAVVRGLVFTVPIVFVLMLLLMSADAVFSNLLNNLWSALGLQISPETVDATLMTLVLALVAIGAFSYSLTREFSPPKPQTVAVPQPTEAAAPETSAAEAATPPLKVAAPPKAFQLSMIETGMILGAVVLLFGAFVLVQVRYFFGGDANIGVAGLTYAEYARRGFFELVLASALTLGLALWLDRFTVRSSGRAEMLFRSLALLLVGLTVVMIFSAAQRMWLYEQAYGFTQLRVYVHVAIFALAALFGVYVLALLRWRPQIFAFGCVLVVIGYLTALNLLNVDWYVAERNIIRYQSGQTQELDVAFINSLSTDALPAVLPLFAQNERGALREWSGQWLARLLARLDDERNTNAKTIFSWNASRTAAWEQLNAIRRQLPAINYDLYWASVTLFDDTLAEGR